MKNPSKAVKTARDIQHFAQTITPKQVERMKEGRVESIPSDYNHFISISDAARLDALRRAEARKDARELKALDSSYE
jgi:hypothetical protein